MCGMASGTAVWSTRIMLFARVIATSVNRRARGDNSAMRDHLCPLIRPTRFPPPRPSRTVPRCRAGSDDTLHSFLPLKPGGISLAKHNGLWEELDVSPK